MKLTFLIWSIPRQFPDLPRKQSLETVKDGIGITPLHHAAGKGHKETTELLIAEDADVNAKDDDGETPLDFATDGKQTETVDLLRKHGGKTGEELDAAGN